MNNKYKFITSVFMLVAVPCLGQNFPTADEEKEVSPHEWNFQSGAGTFFYGGDYMPYYMTTNQHGLVGNSTNGGYLRAALSHAYTYKHFRVHTVFDLVGYLASESSPYYEDHFNVQQFYVDLQWWDKISLRIGAKEDTPMLVNYDLSSGNMIWSENTRPMPMAKLSTTEYIDVPWTRKWVQFYIDAAYGWNTDDEYNANAATNFDRYNDKHRSYHIVQDFLLHRKNFFLRTNPEKPIFVTAGVEHVAEFGGTVTIGNFDGKNRSEYLSNAPTGVKDMMKVFFGSTGNGDCNYTHMASIDLRADGKTKYGSFAAYTQLFMDEFSKHGAIRQNGSDGLYGIEWKSNNENSLVSNVVVEFLKTTNQGGNVFADELYTADGSNTVCHYYLDTYYTDQLLGAYANYGMALGTPMLKSPAYNDDAHPDFEDTLVKAFHLGVKGNVNEKLSYKMLLSYRTSWGTTMSLWPTPRHETSAMLSCSYPLKKWVLSSSLAFDAGDILGDNFGFGLSIKHIGNIF